MDFKDKIIQFRILCRIKIREKTNKYFAKSRRNKLISTDFTIISNNCWGGHVYRYYGLPYSSPTIGLYFSSSEYIKFCSNLEYYLAQEIKVIDTVPPIGKLDDIEIVFLHYKSAKEAKDKWERRKARISHKNILFKYCYQNNATPEDLQNFLKLNTNNKIAFVPSKEMADMSEFCIYFPGYEKEGQILNDTNDFRTYINLTKLINRIYE